ncbi:mechanosensitive ion channel [bacterium]|nr:mechanosensitive ion channel [bacterium]
MASSTPSRRWRLLLLAWALGAAPALAQAGGTMRVEPGEPADLVVWNRPILTMRARIGETSPAERAARAAERIAAIPDSELAAEIRVVSAKVGHLEGLMAFAGSRQLFSILPEDLDPESPETLADAGRAVERNLRELLAARAAQRSLPLLLEGIALSVLATALFTLAAWALVRIERWLEPRLATAAERRGGAAARQVREYVALITRRAAQVGAWAAGAVCAYLWLTFVLSQFPYTQPWGRALGSGLRHLCARLVAGVVDAIPGLITIAIIFVITRLVVRLLHGLFLAVEQGRLSLPGVQRETAEATRRISTVLVWLFAITIAYPYIPGSGTDAFRGVSVFVGLMLSLGSAGLVNQVMSGLVVVYARAIRPGEYVRIGETEGLVSEVGLLSTKLMTVRKEEITIPNSVMTNAATTNYSRLADIDGAVVTTSVTIGYDAPWRQVHALLILAAERTELVRKTPPPRVAQRKLDDYYVEYLLLVNVDQPAQRPLILSLLHANIQDAFNEFGVQIMSPHFVAQPAQTIVVPKDGWRPPPAPASDEP